MDFRSTYTNNLLQKFSRLLDAAGIAGIVKTRDLTAVKLHFGEHGNTAFIRPVFIRQAVDRLKELGASPFLTDTNTLYSGTRSDTPHHIETAIRNGFSYSVVGAPIVIADGLRGRNDAAVSVGQKHFETVFIGADIANADAIVSIAHFKGHELTGFGGTLKNIGMGCASRRGKLAQHSTVSPKIKRSKCIGCGECTGYCPQSAISLRDGRALIDGKRCIGCGECILICASKAIRIRWNQTAPLLMEAMVEHAYGALTQKAGKALFVNFVTDVSPACDCPPYNDSPIVRDIGILAATDPVAVDQASADLVNLEPGIGGCTLSLDLQPGQDKFKALYPEVDWERQLEYAEKIGLGSRTYRLVKIE